MFDNLLRRLRNLPALPAFSLAFAGNRLHCGLRNLAFIFISASCFLP